METKYNLTIWQRIQLPIVYLFWLMTDPENRKSWHEVKKGAEEHKHNFVKPHRESGYDWLKCDHEGCNLMEPLESEYEKARTKRINDYMANRSWKK